MTIRLECVTKKYGKRLAVDGVTFEVPSGQITGFVGANGAGKTTVMRMVMGLTPVSGGHIFADGRRIGRDYRAEIGYMPDQQALYPEMPVKRQLMLFARLQGLKTREARHAIGVLLDRLGLSDRAKEPISALSLGNRRKVQLASMLLHSPTALIMDEPFSGLDPQAVDYMEPVLREYAAAGIPVLFSSHQLDLVERLCDQLVIIGEGHIIADGSVAELTQCGPGRLVVRYADWASLPDASLPDGVSVVAHEPDRKEIIITVDPQRQSEVIRQLADTLNLLEVSSQKVTLAESYRGIIEGEEG